MSKFDKNRNLQEVINEGKMEELNQRICELEAVLRQQEQRIAQQNQQLEAAASRQQQQQEHQINLQHQQQLHVIQQQQQPEGLCLNPQHIINEFRRIKPLDERHNVRQFILSVESTMALAIGNEPLLAYGLRIIVNEKLEGNAGKMVGELDDGATWQQIKEKLLNGLQPRKTYAEIFNFCRNVKVSDLDELFTIFLRAKFEINEMYQLDIRRPSVYNPASVDRDLVDLLLEKIDGTVRVHIGESDTLQDTISKYTRLKLLTDRRTIDYRHRKNTDKRNRTDLAKNNFRTEIGQSYHKDTNYSKPFADVKTNYGNRAPKENWQNSRSNTFQSQNRRFQNTNNNFMTDNIQQLDRNFKDSGQVLNYNMHPMHQNTNNLQTRSNQTRNYNQSRQQRQSNFSGQEIEPMEIGTIHEDINFHIPPQDPSCP